MKSFRINVARFLKHDTSGGPTVEFVLVFPVLFFFVGFILLLAFDFFWMLTSQKAVERGARMAVTRLPVPGVLIEGGRIINYDLATSVPDGEPCLPGGNCAAVPTYSCRGGAYINQNTSPYCDVSRFNEIYDAVSNFAPNSITPEDLTITYEDSGLGRVTESYIPLVTVELQQARALISFSWLERFFPTLVATTRPSVAAAFVGENMGN